MDRLNVEPGDGLHESQSRLQALLCRNLRRTLARDSGPSLQAGIRPAAVARSHRHAPHVEEAAHDLREQHERPLPRKVPLPFIQRVFETMEKACWHTFQILTKRSKRLADLAPDLNWPPNVWMGVSIETAKYLWRADHLRQVAAAVKFLSLEPLWVRWVPSTYPASTGLS